MHHHARTLPYGLQTFPFKRCSFVAWEKDEQKREQINPDHFSLDKVFKRATNTWMNYKNAVDVF